MTTLRYGITCSYFALVLNVIATVVMFSVFLRLFSVLFPDYILQIFDPVTEWILDQGILDFEQYGNNVVYRNAEIYSLLLDIASILLLISSLMFILGFSNYNRCRRAAVCGLIGLIIVYSEFRYCGNESFAIIVLALFFNISVIMSIPKITNNLVENARYGILDSGDLEFGKKEASPSELRKDVKLLSKVQNRMDHLGEKMFEEKTVGQKSNEIKKPSRTRKNDDKVEEPVSAEADIDTDTPDQVEPGVEQTPDVEETTKEDSEKSADAVKSRKERQRKSRDKKKK